MESNQYIDSSNTVNARDSKVYSFNRNASPMPVKLIALRLRYFDSNRDKISSPFAAQYIPVCPPYPTIPLSSCCPCP